MCNGKWSKVFREGYIFDSLWNLNLIGGIKDGSEITQILDNRKSVNKMYFKQDSKILQHAIINVPAKGVYFGVCMYI